MADGPRLPGDMPDSWENVFNLFEATKGKGDSKPGEGALATIFDATQILPIESFPDRPWIVHGHFLRGAVTVVAGPGSAGKSMLCIAWAIAMALGRSWANEKFKVKEALRVMLLNVEDNNLEQQRRIHATMAQWSLGPKPCTIQDLSDRLSWVQPTNTGLMLKWFKETEDFRETELFKWLLTEVKVRKPDVLFLDPLVELHSANENDNTALRMVVAKFRAMAEALDIAIVLVHHTRKGSNNADPDDPEGVRGAGSIVGAARVVMLVRTMTADEAREFSIQEDQRKDYFRVDSAKQNYAPARAANWFTRDPCQVGNEIIVGAKPWDPPVTDGIVGMDEEAKVIRGIEEGWHGVPWASKLSKDERSVKRLFEQLGHTTHEFQANLLRRLKTTGVIEEARFKDATRHEVIGLRANGLPRAKWCEAGDE